MAIKVSQKIKQHKCLIKKLIINCFVFLGNAKFDKDKISWFSVCLIHFGTILSELNF